MENMELPVKKIRRAQIRYYETDRNACEIPELKAYTYFLDVDGYYINIFHPLEECNIYKRVPIPNFTKNGESFGTKIELVHGKEEDGVCYILDNPDRIVSIYDYISIEDFEDLIINMKDFIVDRVEILEKRKDIFSRFKNRKIIESDKKNLEILQEYVISKDKEIEKVYKKD